jgi:hypothetical protein
LYFSNADVIKPFYTWIAQKEIELLPRSDSHRIRIKALG